MLSTPKYLELVNSVLPKNREEMDEMLKSGIDEFDIYFDYQTVKRHIQTIKNTKVDTPTELAASLDQIKNLEKKIAYLNKVEAAKGNKDKTLTNLKMTHNSLEKVLGVMIMLYTESDDYISNSSDIGNYREKFESTLALLNFSKIQDWQEVLKHFDAAISLKKEIEIDYTIIPAKDLHIYLLVFCSLLIQKKPFVLRHGKKPNFSEIEKMIKKKFESLASTGNYLEAPALSNLTKAFKKLQSSLVPDL